MAVNITNQPIDRRRLSQQDRADINRSGRHAAAKKAVAFITANRGRDKMERNRAESASPRSTGSADFMHGVAIQQARVRQQGAENRRAESLRPSMPDTTQTGTPRPTDQDKFENYRDRQKAIYGS